MIPVNEPLLDGNEKKYLIDCIDTGWISSEGPYIKRFEDEFSSLVGREFGIAVANGSLALEAAVVALGLGEGDEVIMPSFTIISCASALVRVGAIPVLIDSDPLTWNIDVNEIESKITSRTKAMMIVHIYGLPCDLDPILDLAKKYSLKIIEDAAEMHGQTYKGRPCGSFGDISIFSFYPNKHITTGEGGMIVTNSNELADKCRGLRNLCFLKEQRFVHEELGWNMRMTNLQAALGVAQLERLSFFIQKKRSMGDKYNSLLKDIPGIQLPLNFTNYAKNIYWVYGIVLNESKNFDAKDVMRMLAKKGVGTRPFFWPMHEQPVFLKKGLFNGVQCPVASNLARRGFYIPSGMALTDDQINFVAEKIREVLG